MRDRESIGGLLKNRREKKWDKKQRVNKTREGEEEGKRERERGKKKQSDEGCFPRDGTRANANKLAERNIYFQ